MARSGHLSAPTLESSLRGGELTGSWTLVPAASEVRLKSRALWGLVPVTGTFQRVTGGGIVSEDGHVRGAVTVEAASLDTANDKRDASLRSSEFLDADRYPAITFRVQGTRPQEDATAISGTLTVRERTRPVRVLATVEAIGRLLRLDGELHIDRADFGLMWNRLGLVSMRSTISAVLVFARD
jgi:polyisoprenoid-binding protein YceI